MPQLAILHGKHQPKDIWLFFSPLITKLKHLPTKSFKLNCENDTHHSRFQLLMMTGDISAVADLFNLKGHVYYFGCRVFKTNITGIVYQREVGKK
jgi:hypothetical protein